MIQKESNQVQENLVNAQISKKVGEDSKDVKAPLQNNNQPIIQIESSNYHKYNNPFTAHSLYSGRTFDIKP